MAEEPENHGAESAIVDRDSKDQTDSNDSEAAGSHTGVKQRENAPSEKKKKSSKKGIRRIKYIIGFLIIFLVVTAWSGTKYGSGLMHIFKKREPIIHLSDFETENLTEKILQPLFVPLGKDAEEGIMRIDFSVIWDGLASVRYDNMRLLVRDRLYRDISSTAAKNKDAENREELLENKMGSILREALGMNNLIIKIKEINYF